MFTKFLTGLSVVCATAAVVAAKPTDVPAPVAGLYTIQNVGTGLTLDVPDGSQAPGTSVIASTPSNPATSGQEWTLSFPGFAALQQSTGPYIHAAFDSDSGITFLDLAQQVPSEFTLTSSATGINICFDPIDFGCFTSPDTDGGKVTLEAFTGAPEQTWLFNSVTN